MVIEEKWIEFLSGTVQTELDRISQGLASRVTTLAERYAEPLPVLVNTVESLTEKVEGHLRRMGFIV